MCARGLVDLDYEIRVIDIYISVVGDSSPYDKFSSVVREGRRERTGENKRQGTTRCRTRVCRATIITCAWKRI